MSKLDAQIDQFEKALARLKEVLELPKDAVVRDSAIQRFEFTSDIGWKTLKVYLEEKKGVICKSPKECFREAYKQGVVEYEDKWIEVVDMRNETVHTYNEQLAEEIFGKLPGVVLLFDSLLGAVKV